MQQLKRGVMGGQQAIAETISKKNDNAKGKGPTSRARVMICCPHPPLKTINICIYMGMGNKNPMKGS